MSYYETLGVAPTASDQEIRKKYLDLAKKFHPDKAKNEEELLKNQELFKEISAANDILSDSERRKTYDYLLAFEQNPSLNDPQYQERKNAWEAWETERKKERERRESFENPNADFTNSNGEEREDARSFRRELYGYEQCYYDYKAGRINQQSCEKLSPRTRESLGKKRRDSDKDPFERPNRLLKRLKKYLAKVGKPYQAYQTTSLDLMADLAQPIYGVGNLLMAALYVFCFAVTLCFSPIAIPIAYLINLNQNYHTFYKLGKGTVELFASQLKSIATFSLLGLTQLIATPITWFVVIPYRSLITLMKGSETIEQSPHIQRIIKEAEAGLEQDDKIILRVTTALLHRKFEYAVEHKKRYSKLTKDESKLFDDGIEKEFVLGTLNPQSTIAITEKQKNEIRMYLNFFKPSETLAKALPVDDSFPTFNSTI